MSITDSRSKIIIKKRIPKLNKKYFLKHIMESFYLFQSSAKILLEIYIIINEFHTLSMLAVQGSSTPNLQLLYCNDAILV